MTPSYQRNAVWTERQKSYLVDSVLNGYPIPEIYVQEVIDEEGSSKCIIVDGQQRLRAILEYENNEFGLNTEDSPSFNGAKFCELSSDLKKKFYSYNFVVRSLPELSDSEIRQIFKRLNQNVEALNAQELRKAAYTGPLISLVSTLSKRREWSLLRIFTPNDVKRMKDEEFISELALAIVEGITNKKDNLESFYENSEINFPYVDKIYNSVIIILKTLSPISSDIARSRWRNKTDFYTLFLALNKHLSKLPFDDNEQLDNLREKLIEISNEVYACLKVNEGAQNSFSEEIKNYTQGVRASSDITARFLRQNALDALLEPIFK